jgi:hypothetical protein
MGTSTQVQIGGDEFKRSISLNKQPEKVVDIDDQWRTKRFVENPVSKPMNTHERLYEYASNVKREPEDGCMKKIKIERSLKLRQEDVRSKSYNILNGATNEEKTWINAYDT